MSNVVEVQGERCAVITIVGVGKWGCDVFHEFPLELASAANLVAAHSNLHELSACPVRTLVLLEEGAVFETCEADPDSEVATLREEIAGSDLVILIGDPAGDSTSDIFLDLEAWCLTQGILTRSVASPATHRRLSDVGPGREAECSYLELAVGIAADIPRLVQTFCYAICGVILKTSSIGVDFADVRTILEERGRSTVAMGVAHGEGRAHSAAMAALHSTPDFINQVISAQAVLALIISKEDPGLDEFSEVGDVLGRYLPFEATVVIGVVTNSEMRETDMEVLVLVTSINDAQLLSNDHPW